MSLFGHTIPKRSHVVPNLYGILHDPEVFPEPEKFDPERFLETDPESGAIRVRKVEEFVPFGVGRRVCLGRSLAEREVCRNYFLPKMATSDFGNPLSPTMSKSK